MDKSEQFVKAFVKAFPHAWMKVIDGAPTTGEGAEVNGLPLYDPFEEIDSMYAEYTGKFPTAENSSYEMHVHKTVVRWAKERGWHPEKHDAGTLKFYRD